MRKPGVIRVPIKQYARMEKLLAIAPKKSCGTGCAAYWGSPRDCECGADSYNKALDEWRRDLASGFKP
jgi:hypothetical protein